MLTTAFIAMWMAAAAPQPQAQASDAPPVVLEVAAHLYQAGNRPTDRAGSDGTDTFEKYVWSDTLCGLTSGDHAPSKVPSVGWHFSAHVVSRAVNVLSVQIDWQRMWEHGKALAAGQKGTLQIQLGVDHQVELDRVDLPSGACGAVSARLEADVVQHLPRLGGRGGRGIVAGAATGADTGTAATGRGGRGVGAGMGGRGVAGGVGTGGRSGATAGAQGQGQGQQGQPGQSWMLKTQVLPPQSSAFNAELWLVHTPPNGTADLQARQILRTLPVTPPQSGRGGTEAIAAMRGTLESLREFFSLRQTLRLPASGAGFVFPAVAIATTRGTVSVIVMGTLSVSLVNGEPTALVVTVSRHITSTDPSATTTGGSSTKTIPWASVGEVVSFELPPAGDGTQDLLAGHQFALRVRIIKS